MYKVTRFYSEPQNKTTVQLESKSVDSSDYEYYVKALNGDLREVSDEEVVKMVLDTVRIKLNPNEAVTTLDEKIKELDNVIQRAEEQMKFSQMAMFELTEMVYGLMELMLEPEPETEILPEEDVIPEEEVGEPEEPGDSEGGE